MSFWTDLIARVSGQQPQVPHAWRAWKAQKRLEVSNVFLD
jgi:hypothetical protein